VGLVEVLQEFGLRLEPLIAHMTDGGFSVSGVHRTFAQRFLLNLALDLASM
jgi:hypothetical protein